MPSHSLQLLRAEGLTVPQAAHVHDGRPQSWQASYVAGLSAPHVQPQAVRERFAAARSVS
ncbi:hypothetical protein GCM10020295_83760 [Streptomyces cinereospinus]